MSDDAGAALPAHIRFDDCEFDLRRFELRRSGQVVTIEPQVFAVLAHLIEHRDRVVTKEELLDSVWGTRFVTESALTSRIKTARAAVGDDGNGQRVIRTSRGRGYQFVARVRETDRPEPSRAATRLLERDDEIAALDGVLHDASQRGRGAVVFVEGEAGIGKSSLVQEFAQRAAAASARVLMGTCDDMATPRVLGPFHDMARGAGPQMQTALSEGDRDALLGALAVELEWQRTPPVLIIEDAHWADDATIDVLRWLIRRVASTVAVLVITYRPADVQPGHPLQRVLGSVPGGSGRHLALHPLSVDSIHQLAEASGHAVDANALLTTTSGNPFFVTEVLAEPHADVPRNVADAVLARVQTLPDESRQALERLSVIPGSVDVGLATALLGDLALLVEAERHGMVLTEAASVRFRHELARRAVEASVPALVRRTDHAEVLAHLSRLGAAPATLVHHAEAAGDRDALITHARDAAEEAAAVGAHRQAAALYAKLLTHADRLDRAELAHVLAAHAYEYYVLNDLTAARAEAERAVRLARSIEDDLLEAQALTTLSRIQHWWAEDTSELAERAIELVGVDGPADLLATACVNLASDLILTDRHREGAEWATRAYDAARRAGREDLQVLAAMYEAVAAAASGQSEAGERVADAISIAERIGAWEYAARGCINMVALMFRQGRTGDARVWIDRAIADAEEGEFLMGLERARALHAGLLLYTGEYDDAERELRGLIRSDDPASITWLPKMLLARVLSRRGDPAASDAVDAAVKVVEGVDDPNRLLAVEATRIEYLWLCGDNDAVVAHGLEAIAIAERIHHPQLRGEISCYVMRAGGEASTFDSCPLPYALSLAGEHAQAAELWDALGFPFERELELAASEPVD